jgi:hypothetical protein
MLSQSLSFIMSFYFILFLSYFYKYLKAFGLIQKYVGKECIILFNAYVFM